MTDRIKQMAEEAGIRRYDLERWGGDPAMECYPDGDYITWDDALKLAALVAEDLAEFVRMKQQRSGRTDIDGIKHGHWPVDLAEQMIARYGIKGE